MVTVSNVGSNDATKQENKREEVREELSGWSAILFIDKKHLTGIVDNKSLNGLGINLAFPVDDFKQDMDITISLKAHNNQFTRQGLVRWVKTSSDNTELGVQLIDHVDLTPSTHQLDVEKISIDPTCALKIPAQIALRRNFLPFVEFNGSVHLACADTSNQMALKAVERMVKAPVIPWTVNPDTLKTILNDVYGDVVTTAPQTAVKKITAQDDGEEATQAGEELLYAAYLRGASDIHLDPGYKNSRIRFRVDGQLEMYKELSNSLYHELSSRLKVMASLDISERRMPQDGRFSHQFVEGGRRIDVRVATLPTKYGERITMRLLAVQTASLTLDRLGFEPDGKLLIENFLTRIQGMMVLTGPTGSGKTTTLYAAIRLLLEERSVNIITIEDPIEYEIDSIAQCEVDSASKVTFASALRSILRHDPDVVMIGEIRDKETADIAIKASLTGHMVLGTLHTNSAAATITRLIDMGVEPYMVAAALRLVVAQRLLRRLCSACKIPRPLSEKEAFTLLNPELAGKTVYEPSGCIYCSGKGYSGRIGLYEMLSISTEWARGIAEGMGEGELVEKMKEAEIHSLLENAIKKLLNGDTSVFEVIQIASSW